MDTYYDVSGAPVVATNVPPLPFNPLRRPKVSYRNFKIALGCFILMETGITAAGIAWLAETTGGFYCLALICLIAALIYISAISRRSIIWLVHLYQSKAPAHVRLQCVFMPSCSEYMILAVKRYGTIIGIYKGIRRLWRCHWPNGGYDWP